MVSPTLLGVGPVHEGLQRRAGPLLRAAPAAPAAAQRPPPRPVATPCGMGAASWPLRHCPPRSTSAAFVSSPEGVGGGWAGRTPAEAGASGLVRYPSGLALAPFLCP